MFNQNKNQKGFTKGFTLIELLVVIAVMGLLISVMLTSVNSARKKSRDGKRAAEAVQMRSALEMYYLDNGGFPVCGTALNEYTCSGAGITSAFGTILTKRDNKDSNWWDIALVKIANAEIKYIGKIPTDPLNSGANVFYYITNTATRVITDANGATVTVADRASFFYVSESKSTAAIPAYTEGISVGTPDFSIYTTTGYPGALNNTLGTGVTPTYY